MPADLPEAINTHRKIFGGFAMETTDPPPADPWRCPATGSENRTIDAYRRLPDPTDVT